MRRRKAFQFLQAFHGLHRLEGIVVDVRGVQAAALLERIFRQRREKRLELLLHRYEEPDVVAIPADVHPRFARCLLIRVGPEVGDHRPAGHVAHGRGDVAVLTAKGTFQSFQRTAFRSPP